MSLPLQSYQGRLLEWPPRSSAAPTRELTTGEDSGAPKVDAGSFSECQLMGLNFGDYELIDPVLIDVANSNNPDDAVELILSNSVARSLVSSETHFSPRGPFILDDELEEEAARRRLEQPIEIPERRFGRLLSPEFALRFRYYTSWDHAGRQLATR
jgi:hypothetical protein